MTFSKDPCVNDCVLAPRNISQADGIMISVDHKTIEQIGGCPSCYGQRLYQKTRQPSTSNVYCAYNTLDVHDEANVVIQLM